MFYVKLLASNVFIAVNYCWRQLAQSFGWAAPACHKKESSTLSRAACTYGWQYDGRPDGRLGVHVGMWNLGSLSGKGEFFEELRKRMIDVRCLQNVRWGGQGARMKRRRYRLWWSGR